MIIDAVDKGGRRYMEVPAWQGVVPDAPAQACVECGAWIRHGSDRYFQRNDADDGSGLDSLGAVLMSLTYDPVCATCGDRLIQESAT